MQHFPPHVLVLEDDEQTRDLVVEILRDGGMQVDAAADGWAALEKIEAAPFDLIVADLRLPGDIDGLDTVRRARTRQPALRSLIISASRLQWLGDPIVDDFVEKQFDPRELLGCVWELLLRKPRRPTKRELGFQRGSGQPPGTPCAST